MRKCVLGTLEVETKYCRSRQTLKVNPKSYFPPAVLHDVASPAGRPVKVALVCSNTRQPPDWSENPVAGGGEKVSAHAADLRAKLASWKELTTPPTVHAMQAIYVSPSWWKYL
jgi:hypothetical protein